MSVQTVLSGHISPETAFVVKDYPYGFRLRCKIRYWLEHRHPMGVRLVTQTTNPKKPGEVWNKPKASTYSEFGGAMFLDENDHVQWSGLSRYSSAAESEAFRDSFGAGVPESIRPLLDKWVEAKRIYESRQSAA